MSTVDNERTNPLCWGIVGAGAIAHRFAEDAKAAIGAEVTAVAARAGDRAATFAEQHAIPVFHSGYDALFADPSVDAVYVATPHSLHFEHALAAIRAGKPVLVEKPFTVNGSQAEQLAQEAQDRGVFLMEAMWTMCNPVVQQLRQRIAAGAIGTPLSLTANVGPMGIPVERGSGHRLEDPALGASFMLEALVYPLWLTTAFLPALRTPASVAAAASLSAAGVDETASILLAGGDGSVACMGGGVAFAAQGGPASLLQITGTAGWAEIADDLFDPQLARLGTADGVENISAQEATRGFAWEIEEASRAVRADKLHSDIVPVAQSVQVMRILDSARRSAGIAIGAERAGIVS